MVRESFIGYAFLRDQYQTVTVPLKQACIVGNVRTPRRIDPAAPQEIWAYPQRSAPGPASSDLDHVLFALRHEVLDLCLLSQVFGHMVPQSIADFVQLHPTSVPRRRLWFLYEYLTGAHVPLPDMRTQRSVDLLSPETYVVGKSTPSPRHRVRNNLVGTPGFCPRILNTPTIQMLGRRDWKAECQQTMHATEAHIWQRVLTHLYLGETKDSWRIESESVDPTRAERFVYLLTQAHQQDYVYREGLEEVARLITGVPENSCYRDFQSYVGAQTLGMPTRMNTDMIGCRPQDVEALMAGLCQTHRRMTELQVPPVVHAAAISYGLVFIHPFGDGNGRTHRFLLHNILAGRDVTPPGTIFPLSSYLLKHFKAYIKSLQDFARHTVWVPVWTVNAFGEIRVETDTAPLFRFPDLTLPVETVYRGMVHTVEHEIPESCRYVAGREQAYRTIHPEVDMSDHKLFRFIDLCYRNGGKLAKRQRKNFRMLSDEAIARYETIIQRSFRLVPRETHMDLPVEE